MIVISGFKEGYEEIEDDPRSGRPSTARPITEKKIEEIGKVIHKDHRFSIRSVAWIVGVDKESVRQIEHNNFNKGKVSVKIVP